MSIAHDYASESHTGTTGSTSAASFTWTHSGRAAASGGVQGAVVFTFVNTGANHIAGVTYGGVAMVAVTSGQALDTAGEPGCCKAWFLGNSCAGDNQTVSVTCSQNAQVKYAVCATVTGSYNTKVHLPPVVLQEDGILAEQNINTGGFYAIRYAGIFSGSATPRGVGTNTTSLQQIDYTSSYYFQ